MTDHLPPLSLRQGMQIWKGEQQAIPGDAHIPLPVIAQMAMPGGLEDVDEAQMEHLASCAECLEKWAALCCENTPIAPVATADDWYSGGMLEAASTDWTGRPLSLRSRCGNFLLRLLPEKGDSTRCMAILEITGSARPEFEGCRVQVRDSRSVMFLEGMLTSGRLARLVKGIEQFDFTIWSMVVQSKNHTGEND